MSAEEQAVLHRLNADNWAALYRCRWSAPDADRVVPQLAHLLESDDFQIIDEALRALFRIGTAAVSAAGPVAKLTQSVFPITRRLAVLTLGQISHNCPAQCVEPLASVLTDPMCCRDSLRVLAFIGPKAETALDRVLLLFKNTDAKVRKAVVMAAASINAYHPGVVKILRLASEDRSKIVREAADKFSKNPECANDMRLQYECPDSTQKKF
jgi:HEAT repeat protein